MSTLLAPILAWTPFLQPIELHQYWLVLLPPIVIAVALIYKTLKLKTLEKLPWETTKLSGYIMFLMVLAAVVLWVVVEAVERV